MSAHEKVYAKVVVALDELFDQVFVSKEETRSSLENLIVHIQTMLDALDAYNPATNLMHDQHTKGIDNKSPISSPFAEW